MWGSAGAIAVQPALTVELDVMELASVVDPVGWWWRDEAR